ncbi:MAG: serine/threonine protein kinase [Acidobacteriota bacterium]
MEPVRLGRYVIEKVLGKGAMGTVYLGRDPVIGRRLALKTLHVKVDSDETEEFRQRFLREAQAAGILTHAGIVTVHDAGVDDLSGLSFIAMEYIEGNSLKDLLRGGHMFAFSEVARIGAALAAALDYAHSKGVVHRDIKPANIILTPQGTAKITDFGVARLESSNLTATGQFIGTPNYMSPEQVTGSPVDGRSDLFSLGVVLFELMTGQRPFVGASLTEVSYKIVHEPAPIPSQVRRGLPPSFNPIVLKLLEKEPAKRYQKGADVARALDALRRVLSGTTGEGVTVAASGPQPAPPTEGGTVMSGAATATRATVIGNLPAEPPAPAAKPRIWRLPIEPRWVTILLLAAAIPPALVVILLLGKIDRGPWPAPVVGEAQRRHLIGVAQRQASEALAAGNADRALADLAKVWDQAPYSRLARELRERALAMKSAQADQRQRQAEVLRLLDEGKGLLRQGRFRDAEGRFRQALEASPGDALVEEWLEAARERARMPRATREVVVPTVSAAPAPVAAALGPARLELYFNSPLSAGSVEIKLDGQLLASKAFNFYTKGFLGMGRKKGSGIVEDAYAVPSGPHRLSVQLRGDEEGQLWEQQIPVTLPPNGQAQLKIEMGGERAVPRFSVRVR